jgi:hypothetical protein
MQPQQGEGEEQWELPPPPRPGYCLLSGPAGLPTLQSPLTPTDVHLLPASLQSPPPCSHTLAAKGDEFGPQEMDANLGFRV